MTPYIFVSVIVNPGEEEPHTEVIRYDNFVNRLFKGGTEKEELLHWSLGMMGEIAELWEAEEEEHKIEELGDFGFYFWKGASHFNIDLEQLENLPWTRTVQSDFLIAAGALVDLVKKRAIYNKPVDRQNLVHMFNTVYTLYIRYINVFSEKTFPAILQANAEKLAKRYIGLTYTDEAAQARRDKDAEQK